jgi:hypothetical protein
MLDSARHYQSPEFIERYRLDGANAQCPPLAPVDDQAALEIRVARADGLADGEPAGPGRPQTSTPLFTGKPRPPAATTAGHGAARYAQQRARHDRARSRCWTRNRRDRRLPSLGVTPNTVATMPSDWGSSEPVQPED